MSGPVLFLLAVVATIIGLDDDSPLLLGVAGMLYAFSGLAWGKQHSTDRKDG